VTSRPLRILGALAVLALAIGTSACVSVFPKSKPAQMYTFGRPTAETGPATAQAPAADRTGILLAAVTFPRAAQGDTLLTMTGAQAAYIEESRWVAPAVVLFREAVERRFDDEAQRTRLVARGDLGRTSLILRLDVRQFEAVYAYPEAVPSVAVSVRARLASADGSPLQERSFEIRRPLAENRVTVIVDGLDKATTEILGQLVTWADAAVAAGRPAGAGGAAAAVRSTSSSVSTSTTTTVRPVP